MAYDGRPRNNYGHIVCDKGDKYPQEEMAYLSNGIGRTVNPPADSHNYSYISHSAQKPIQSGSNTLI